MTETNEPGVQANGWKGAARKFASAVGWVWGGLSILTGLMFLAVGPGASQRMIGLSAVCAGLLLMPPIVKAIRQRVAFMRTPGLPTIAAMVVGVTILIVTPWSTRSIEPAEKSMRTGITARAFAGPQVDLVREDDPMRPAQDALNRGDVATAVTSYFSASVPQERRASPEGQRLRSAMQAGMDRDTGRSPSERASRAFRAQMLVMSGLSSVPPTAPDELWQRVDAYAEAARVLSEHPPAPLDPDTAQERRDLVATVVEKQRADFPVLRRSYGTIVGRAAWEQDVEIVVQGDGGRTIRFIAAMFAANRNIASAQRTALPNIQKLRFGRSQFEWYRGSEHQYYSLETPSDPTVGYWEGGRFMEVD